MAWWHRPIIAALNRSKRIGIWMSFLATKRVQEQPWLELLSIKKSEENKRGVDGEKKRNEKQRGTKEGKTRMQTSSTFILQMGSRSSKSSMMMDEMCLHVPKRVHHVVLCTRNLLQSLLHTAPVNLQSSITGQPVHLQLSMCFEKKWNENRNVRIPRPHVLCISLSDKHQ